MKSARRFAIRSNTLFLDVQCSRCGGWGWFLYIGRSKYRIPIGWFELEAGDFRCGCVLGLGSNAVHP